MDWKSRHEVFYTKSFKLFSYGFYYDKPGYLIVHIITSRNCFRREIIYMRMESDISELHKREI
jgi:hypothetical protein